MYFDFKSFTLCFIKCFINIYIYRERERERERGTVYLAHKIVGNSHSNHIILFSQKIIPLNEDVHNYLILYHSNWNPCLCFLFNNVRPPTKNECSLDLEEDSLFKIQDGQMGHFLAH